MPETHAQTQIAALDASPPQARDWLFALGLTAVFVVTYLCLRQAPLEFDGAWFIYLASYKNPASMAPHVLFSRLLAMFLKLGALLGWTPVTTGIFQSALLMSASLGVYFLILRRLAIDRRLAAVSAVLLGSSMSALVNGTMVELYGASLFFVALNCLWFLIEIQAPSTRSFWVFPLTGALVAACHIGFLAWPLCMFASLGIVQRADRRKLLRRAAQLVVMMTLLALAYARARQGHAQVSGNFSSLLSQFWRDLHGWQMLGRLLEAPCSDFNAYAGLVLAPAVLGFRLNYARLPALAWHAVLTTVSFFGFYAFWTVDYGSFYLPIILSWGVFAALALQQIALAPRSRPRRAFLVFAALDLLVILVSLHELESSHSPSVSILPIAGFYALLAAQWLLWPRLLAGGTADPASNAGPNSFFAAVLIAGLAANAVAYGPLMNFKRLPDADGDKIAALGRVVPCAAPKAVRLVTAIAPPFRAFAEGGYDSLPMLLPGESGVFEMFNTSQFLGWLNDAALPGNPPLWMDEESHRKFKANLRALHLEHVPNGVIRALRKTEGGFAFYKIEVDGKIPITDGSAWPRKQ